MAERYSDTASRSRGVARSTPTSPCSVRCGSSARLKPPVPGRASSVVVGVSNAVPALAQPRHAPARRSSAAFHDTAPSARRADPSPSLVRSSRTRKATRSSRTPAVTAVRGESGAVTAARAPSKVTVSR